MKRRLRVLQVIASVSNLHGGPSAVVRQLSAGLAVAGLDVDVASTDASGKGRQPAPFDAPLTESGVRYFYFPRQLATYTVSWPLSSWLWRHASDYDVIHIHGLFSYPNTTAAWIARHRRIPYVIRPLGVLNAWGMVNRRPGLKRLSYRLIEQPILARAAAIQFTSEQEKQEAEALGLCPQSWIIPNPVPMEFDASGQEPKSRSGCRILFLSRIDRKKGLDLLIRAFARVRIQFRGAELTIAGSGDEVLTGELRRLAAELGVEDSIHWAGFVAAAADKQRLFAEADVFVLPSYSENFGVAVVEAMAAGLPIVISDQVGIHTEVTARRAGLVAPCRPERIAAEIERLLRDPALGLSLSHNAMLLAKERYSVAAVCAEVETMYRQIAQ